MNFKPEVIEAVWQHGRVMPEADPSVWRQDACGAWMQRSQFGRLDSEFGWKIESIVAGAPERVDNLRPFHCRNRFDPANKRPHCQATADRIDVPADQRAGPPRNRILHP